LLLHSAFQTVPVEAKPLFRPDVLRAHLAGFQLPAHVEAVRPKLDHWAGLIANRRIDRPFAGRLISRLIRAMPSI